MKKFWAFLKSKTFWKHFGIAVLSLALLIWIAFKSLDLYTRHGETVDVPNFVDQKITALDGFVQDKNVGYEIIDSLYDPKRPPGQVIRQDPDPGTKVKKGRPIYLYVTATVAPKIECPKLENLSARQAMAVAESYGLKPRSKTQKADCNGCVVKQQDKNGKRIAPGTPIDKGTEIWIIVGKNEGDGSGDIRVPNLVGLTYRQARSRLQDVGLDPIPVPDVLEKRFDTLSAVVYRQRPGPSSERMLSPGSSVDLFLTHDKSKLGEESEEDSTDTP